jgi:hypothetical protein
MRRGGAMEKAAGFSIYCRLVPIGFAAIGDGSSAAPGDRSFPRRRLR